MLQAGYRRPTLQRSYRSDAKHVARVDFNFEPDPVIIEVGGRRGYLSADELWRQEHRRNNLQLVGRIIYFFSTEDVAEDPTYLLTTLTTVLREGHDRSVDRAPRADVR